MKNVRRSLRRHLGPVALGMLLFSSVVVAQVEPANYDQDLKATGGWTANFPKLDKVQGAGEYNGDVVWNLENHSPLTLEPTPSGYYEILEQSGKNMLVYHDTVPALLPNPNPPPFFRRSPGAICALGWVRYEMGDQMLSGIINPEARVAHSRQGLMARWDLSNSFYWLYIDYSAGSLSILRSWAFGEMGDLEGAKVQIEGFQDNNPYFLELKVAGGKLEGRAYEIDRKTWDKKKLVAEVHGEDPKPVPTGHSGFLMETARQQPYVTLAGSVARMTAIPIQEDKPRAASSHQNAEVTIAEGTGEEARH